MAQKILLTEELRNAMVEEFRKSLEKTRVTAPTFTYTKALTGYKEPAHLIYSPIAWIKQRILVEKFQKEIAWYGLMERREAAIPTYYVKDIVVYPQRTTFTTVDVDNEVYPEWYGNQPDEFYTEMRMQGHSHVDFATSPSPTDKDHWNELIAKVPADSFFVVVIANQKMEHYVNIYDFKSNTKYESSDVTLFVDGISVPEILADANAKLTSIPEPPKTSYGYPQTTATGKATSRPYGYYSNSPDPYDDADWDDYYDASADPRWPGRTQSSKSTPPKTTPVTPAPKTSVPSVPGSTPRSAPAVSQMPISRGSSVPQAAYTSKFGKRG